MSKVTLTDLERGALEDARMDDEDRRAGYYVLGPGGVDGNTPTLYETVEKIVERRLTAQRKWVGGRDS